MNALLVGYGAIARRHAQNLKALVDDVRIVALRSAARRGGPVESNIDAEVVSADDAFATSPDIVLICSPAPFHVEFAQRAIEQGCDVLVEKPLSDRIDGIAELERSVDQNQRVCMVAYPFRFYAPLRAAAAALRAGVIGRVVYARAEVGMYLPDWRPGVDYRGSVSARRDLGGGALFELSHEIDIVRWLTGEPERVVATTSQVAGLEIDVEDIAEIMLEIGGGCIASIHVDMAQRVPHRSLRIVGTDGTMEWDMQTHSVRCWNVKTRAWTYVHAEPQLDRNAMYMEMMAHFLDCVRDRRTPDCDLREGAKTLDVILAAHESARTESWVRP